MNSLLKLSDIPLGKGYILCQENTRIPSLRIKINCNLRFDSSIYVCHNHWNLDEYLRSDFLMVGDFCGCNAYTGWCGVACDYWSHLSHIVTSFHQWPAVTGGLLLVMILL